MDSNGKRNNAEDLIDIYEAARVLSTTPATLRKWVAARRVPHVRLGRSVRFSRRRLFGWIAENSQEVSREL